jgi:uncharacterized protein
MKGCSYCYGRFGSKQASKKIVKVIDEKTVKAAIDYAVKSALNTSKKKVRLGLFGGEPTCAWSMLQKSCQYMRKRSKEMGCSSIIGITTNGVMNPNRAEWLAKNLDSIMVSLDGPKDIQNIQRCNSFNLVFATAKKIYEIAPEKLKLRATVTKSSVSRLPEIAIFFGENFPGCRQGYEPSFWADEDEELDTSRDSSFHSLFFDKLLEVIPIARKYNADIRTSAIMLKNTKSSMFCGAAGKNFLVTYDNRVVSCNRMVESDAKEALDFFHFGDFDSGSGKFNFNQVKYEKLKSLSFKNIPGCEDCFAKFSCKGDCPANKAIISHENFYQNRSYRCKEIRNFYKKLLSYILDNGAEGLLI